MSVNKHVAKLAVLDAAGNVLLMRRSKTDTHRPNEWDFPGGGLDQGESPVQAAVRELQEEAGIVVTEDAVSICYAATEFYPDSDTSTTRYLGVVRLAEVCPDIVLSFEHDKAVWVTMEQALRDFPHHFYGKGLAYAREHALLP